MPRAMTHSFKMQDSGGTMRDHILQEMAPRYGSLVDIYSHFLAGERSWLTAIIEPSLEGASEV